MINSTYQVGMAGVGINTAGNTCRQTVSSHAMDRLEQLAGRVEALKERMYSKLDQVMTPEFPRPDNISKECAPPEEIWPAYYDRMRDVCRQMDRHVNSMDAALDRAET